MASARRRAAACAAGLLLASAGLASCGLPLSGALTYYVSPDGSDAATGTSPQAAWRTLGMASSVRLPPGSRLLLRGGARFAGPLTLGPSDAGDPGDPVVISSYGQGEATIASRRSGIAISNTAGVTISNLKITGPATHAARGDGINAFNDLPGGQKLGHLVITGVQVSGFSNGIAIGGANGTSGFRGVRVSDTVVHDNVNAGLFTYGPPFSARSPAYANADVQVTHVTAYHNYGTTKVTASSSGSGILLGSVRGGLVEWSAATGNGGAGKSHQGPEGIWAFNSTRVTIEHNVSDWNLTGNHVDGNGFGLDQNTSDSCLQENLSYGNDGAGYLLYTGAKNSIAHRDTVRFNISSGDAQDANWRFGGINITGHMRDVSVEQNTVVMQPGSISPALQLGPFVRDIWVRNNIFAASAAPVVISQAWQPASVVRLQGNDYSSGTWNWSVRWGSASYPTLAAWSAATGNELVHGHPAGTIADPLLAGPVTGLGNLPAEAAADGFALQPGSPMRGAGLVLSRLAGAKAAGGACPGSPGDASSPDIGAR